MSVHELPRSVMSHSAGGASVLLWQDRDGQYVVSFWASRDWAILTLRSDRTTREDAKRTYDAIVRILSPEAAK